MFIISHGGATDCDQRGPIPAFHSWCNDMDEDLIDSDHQRVPVAPPERGSSPILNWQEGAGRELRGYPVHRLLQTRVSDLDGNGHLNAIRLGHFYEDARAAFHVVTGRDGGRVLVAQLTLRYLAEGKWPGETEVGTGIVRIGVSSLVMGQGLFQAGRCIGLCETVLVNTVDGRSHPFSAGYRSQLERLRLGHAAPPG